MARTERNGYNHNTGKYDGNVRDWSCGNPWCCGGEVSRKHRRIARAKAKQELRNDPEGASNKQSISFPY